MSMINVTFVGNLAKAPEQTCFASGRIKTQFVVAVNSYGGQKPNENTGDVPPDYYRVETWGKLAELAQKYLNKGNQVGVSGRLVMEHWTDKEGNKRVTPIVSATQLSFPPRLTGGKSDGRAHGGGAKSGASIESDDDLFAGARAVTVAEPPADYYFIPKTDLAYSAISGR